MLRYKPELDVEFVDARLLEFAGLACACLAAAAADISLDACDGGGCWRRGSVDEGALEAAVGSDEDDCEAVTALSEVEEVVAVTVLSAALFGLIRSRRNRSMSVNLIRVRCWSLVRLFARSFPRPPPNMLNCLP